MPSLFVTRSHPLPIVVRHQLSRAVDVQRHRHRPPSPSAAVAVSRLSYHRQSSVSREGADCGDRRRRRWRRCRCWTSLLSTLNPSDTLWNPDRLKMSNLCGSTLWSDRDQHHPRSSSVPSFRKTTSGIVMLVACRFSDPPRPPKTLSPLSSVQLVLQPRASP